MSWLRNEKLTMLPSGVAELITVPQGAVQGAYRCAGGQKTCIEVVDVTLADDRLDVIRREQAQGRAARRSCECSELSCLDERADEVRHEQEQGCVYL
jgi:hypothetical protein